MNYAALLFCPDDKTSRVLSQVLADLDFAVEPSTEPFAAVKRLMAQRFDAVVVDCDNDQNAALMFKSVRNSESNQSALTVAVVADQAGVAKAFRLGANLVLTKPINVEQSKGTLRVAKGLLKKGDGAKPASAAAASPARPAAAARPVASAPKPAFVPPPSAPSRVVPSIAASALEREPEPATPIAPDDAAMLESLPAPLNPLQKQNHWPSSAESPLARQASVPSEGHSGSAAAAAPAREPAIEPKSAGVGPAKEEISADTESSKVHHDPIPGTLVHADAPVFSSFPERDASASGDGNGKKIAIAAVALIAIGALAYFFYGKSHIHTAHQPAAQQSQQAQTTPAHGYDASANPSLSSLNPALSVPEPITRPAPMQASGSSNASASQLSAKSASSQTSAEKPSEKAVDKSAATAKTADTTPEPEPLMVKTEAPQPPPAPVAETPAPEPPSISISSNNSSADLSGIVGSGPTGIPRPSAQTMKVSQGVSQGLLIKRVDPVYPKQAVEGRIQGSVQLDAHIAKDGSISSVKVLSGDPVLAAAATDAVKQWKYKPYFLDGQPIAIQTQITVNFKLPY